VRGQGDLETVAREVAERGMAVASTPHEALIKALSGDTVIDVFVAPPGFPGLIAVGATHVQNGARCELAVWPITVQPFAIRYHEEADQRVADWHATIDILMEKIHADYLN